MSLLVCSLAPACSALRVVLVARGNWRRNFPFLQERAARFIVGSESFVRGCVRSAPRALARRLSAATTSGSRGCSHSRRSASLLWSRRGSLSHNAIICVNSVAQCDLVGLRSGPCRARVRASNAATDEALASYDETVLRALEETEIPSPITTRNKNDS